MTLVDGEPQLVCSLATSSSLSSTSLKDGWISLRSRSHLAANGGGSLGDTSSGAGARDSDSGAGASGEEPSGRRLRNGSRTQHVGGGRDSPRAVAVAVQSLERLSSGTDVTPVKARPVDPPTGGQSGFAVCGDSAPRGQEHFCRAAGDSADSRAEARCSNLGWNPGSNVLNPGSNPGSEFRFQPRFLPRFGT